MSEQGQEQEREFELARKQTNAWRDEHGTPILTELFNDHPNKARKLLKHARQYTPNNELTAAAAEIIAYFLDYYECRLLWHPSGDGWTQASFENEVQRFREPAKTKPGEQQRLRLLLHIIYTADKDSYYELTREEILEIVDQLPLSEEDSDIWHSIAGWAFKRKDLELVVRAFEALLINPGREMSQAKWQRVNLMHLLLSGKATRRDIVESIKLLSIRPQLQEFQNELWPACQQAGITDDELEQMLAKRAKKIKAEDAAPHRERKTKSIRSRM